MNVCRSQASWRRHSEGAASGCLLCLLFIGNAVTALSGKERAAHESTPTVSDVTELASNESTAEARVVDLDLMMLRHRMAVGMPLNSFAREDQPQPAFQAAWGTRDTGSPD